MNLKYLKIIAAILALSLMTAACATGGTTAPTTTSTSGPTTVPGGSTNPTTTPSGSTPYSSEALKKAIDLMSAVKASDRPASPALPDEVYRQTINRFSASLLVASLSKQGNVMISPASVYLALAMTLNGADGETKAAMLSLLANQGLTLDLINQASRDWMTLLNRTGAKTTLSVVNSIWFDQDFVPYKPFLQTNADYYAATARKLDFKDKAAAEVINTWVKDATRGTIDKIIDQIRPDAVMFLINAVYFKSDWKVPFEKSGTRNQMFHAPGGDVDTAFMHRIGTMAYLSGNDATGVMLPYDDGQFGFFALLPYKGVKPRDWLARQNHATLFADIATLIGQKKDLSIELALPKFETRYEDSLLDELSTLGMGIAFDPGKADFSRMNESHEKDLYIGDVKHKTFIRVDEKGTEAAAVTSVEMRTTAMPVSDKQLVFDQPFVYGILDLKTGLPLFVGILENPAA